MIWILMNVQWSSKMVDEGVATAIETAEYEGNALAIHYEALEEKRAAVAPEPVVAGTALDAAAFPFELTPDV